jgi:uncharacterized repeat protein (TIGR01451 family)
MFFHRHQSTASAPLLRHLMCLWLVACLCLGMIHPAEAKFTTQAAGDPLAVSVAALTTPPVIASPPGAIQYRLTIRNLSAIAQTTVPKWRLNKLGPVWTYTAASTSAVINAGPPDTTNPTVTTDGTTYLDLAWKPGVGYVLNPGDTLAVTFSVAVPGGAKAGQYFSIAQGQSLTAGITTTATTTAPVTIGGLISADVIFNSPGAITAPTTVAYALQVSNNSNSAGPIYNPKLALTQPDAVVGGWTRLTTGITMTWSRAQPPPTPAVLATWNFQDLNTLLNTYGGGDPHLNPGEWVKVVYSYQVTGAAPVGSYGSRCVLNGDNFSFDSGMQTRIVVGGASAAVGLTQSAYPRLIAQGETSTVTVAVTNTGTMSLTQHDVSDLLPEGLALVAGTSKWRLNSGTYTALGEPTVGSDGAYHWIISTSVPVGSLLEVTFNILAGVYGDRLFWTGHKTRS